MALTGIIQRRDVKLVLTGTPPIEGEIVYATDTDEFGWLASNGVDIIWTNFETPNSIDWGNINGDINLQADLQAELNLKTNVGHIHQITDVNNLDTELENRYLKTEYTSSSTGTADAGKPIITNDDGLVDNSLISSTSFILVGNWTPQVNNEYPQNAGVTVGNFYLIVDVDNNDGYIFTTGDLIGTVVFNSDQLVWSTNGWITIPGNVNPDAYLRLDGNSVMVANMVLGDNKIINVKDGENDQDVVTKLQSETYSNSTKSVIGHSHTNNNGIEVEYEEYDAQIQTHINTTNGNPHQVSFSDLDETPDLAGYTGQKGRRVTVNDTEDGLIFETASGTGMLTGEFIFDDDIVEGSTPEEKVSHGQMRQNHTSFMSTSALYISKFDEYGRDRSYGLSLLRINDFIGYYDNTTGSFNLFQLTALPFDAEGTNEYFTFNVQPKDNEGPAMVEGQTIIIELAFNSAKFFTELQDAPDNFSGAANKFVKVNTGDNVTGTGVEYKALEINDIGFDFAGNGAADSALQVALDTKLGGLGKNNNIFLEPDTALITSTDSINLFSYTLEIIGDNYTAIDKPILRVGHAAHGISLLGTIYNDLETKNNLGLTSFKADELTIKSLIKINPADEVFVGDDSMLTVLRSSDTFDSVVRKDSGDYKIHTEEDFLISEIITTKALAETNETNIASLDTYVGLTVANSGLTLRIETAEANIILNDTDILNLQNADTAHLVDVANPHAVTQTQVGLSQCDNTADIDKPISSAVLNVLRTKLGGPDTQYSDDSTIFLPDTPLVSTHATPENILSYTVLGAGDPIVPAGTAFIKIGQAGMGINFDGVMFNPLLMKNNTAIKAYNSNYTDSKNLISRSNDDANTGSPSLYNSDVIIGDETVKTAIRSTNGYEAVIRHGDSGDSTDYLIYSTKDYRIEDYSLTSHNHNTVYEPINNNIQAHIGTIAGENPHNSTLVSLTDTDISIPIDGNILYYNGTDWINDSSIKTKLDLITVIGSVDLDTMKTDSEASKVITDLITVIGSVDLDIMDSDITANSIAIANTTAITILVDGVNVPVDFDLSNNFELIVTQDSIIDTPTNQLPGTTGYITIQQDATGGWNPTFSVDYKFTTAPTFNTAANAYNVFKYYIVGSNNIAMEFIANYL